VNEYIEYDVFLKKGEEMKVITPKIIPTNTFQAYLMSTKTMRGKLAVCIAKLSEVGAFSDSSPELFAFRQELKEHLPEGLRDG
jgi:hypothetical protein